MYVSFRRVRIDLTPSTSYQRLLVHRCSAYYRLSPEADAATKNIIVYYRTESRMYVALTAVVVALWLMYCLKPSSTYMRADSGGGVGTADYPNHAASSGTSIFPARFNRGRGCGYLRCRRIRSR